MLARSDELTQADAGAILGVNRTTACRWCRVGYLKARKRAGVWFPLLTSVIALSKQRARIARMKAANAKLAATLAKYVA